MCPGRRRLWHSRSAAASWKLVPSSAPPDLTNESRAPSFGWGVTAGLLVGPPPAACPRAGGDIQHRGPLPVPENFLGLDSSFLWENRVAAHGHSGRCPAGPRPCLSSSHVFTLSPCAHSRLPLPLLRSTRDSHVPGTGKNAQGAVGWRRADRA